MPKIGSLSFFIARRYLVSRKSHSVINIISVVSIVTVAVPVMAMIILLSTHNGLTDFLASMYQRFDSDVQISLSEGKVFGSDSLDMAAIREVKGVAAVTEVLEESALFDYNDSQHIGKIRGVGVDFENVVPITDMIESGSYDMGDSTTFGALVGAGVAYHLNLGAGSGEPMTIYMPRRKGSMSLFSFDMYNRVKATPTGTFVLDADTDGKYVIVPIDAVRKLLGYKDMVSSIEIRLADGADTKEVKRQISSITGKDFKVLDRYEQKATLYRVVQNEKWAIYFILLLVLLLASLSLVGAIIMLIIDKREQIETLRTIGAERSLVRRIFTGQGMLITTVGTVVGLILGLTVCYLQIAYGIVPIDAETTLLDAYPVIVRWTDIVIVIASVATVNYLISRATVCGSIK